MLLSGQSPYVYLRFQGGGPGFFSPITAAVVVSPVSWMPVHLASFVVMTVSCGLLAFVVTRKAWWPLLLFASGSLVQSLRAANLTPLVTIGFFLPGAMWLGAVRPNAGLAMLARRPSVRAAALMLAFAGACLFLAPRWPLEWIAAVRASKYHFSPLTAPFGFVLLLALLRWRRPDARMLLAMAVVPCTPAAYEALPLFALMETRTEAFLLALVTLLGYFMNHAPADGDFSTLVQHGRTLVLWTCYVPALVLILRRPNVSAA